MTSNRNKLKLIIMPLSLWGWKQKHTLLDTDWSQIHFQMNCPPRFGLLNIWNISWQLMFNFLADSWQFFFFLNTKLIQEVHNVLQFNSITDPNNDQQVCKLILLALFRKHLMAFWHSLGGFPWQFHHSSSRWCRHTSKGSAAWSVCHTNTTQRRTTQKLL